MEKFQLTEYAKAQIAGRASFIGIVRDWRFDLCNMTQEQLQKLHRLSGNTYVEPVPEPPAPAEGTAEEPVAIVRKK